MPNLSRHSYERYVPTLGDNKTQPQPFYLLVKAGLTVADFKEFEGRLNDFVAGKNESPEAVLAVFGDMVKLGDEPLTIDGQPVTSLLEYLRFALEQLGAPLLVELFGAARHFNSIAGARESFSARLSGGKAFTASDAPKTAGASQNGSSTKH